MLRSLRRTGGSGLNNAERLFAGVELAMSKACLAGAGLAVAMTVLLGLAVGNASAHVPYIGTVKLSGQISGKLTVNGLTTCTATAIRTDRDTIAVEVSTITNGLKPSGAEWDLDFYVSGHKITLPAKSPVEVDLSVINVGRIWGSWASDAAGKAKGTVSFGAGYKSGKINPNRAVAVRL
jgi:hypothetical protein